MQPNPSVTQFQLKRVQCGDISLHVAQIGKGPAVIFLHGFPEHWRAFAPMMAALSDQFHCIAPDQRGFGHSDRPAASADYKIDQLADDIAGLIQALGLAQVDIIGHDWGGLVAWHLASRHPALLRRLVVFNAPHPHCLQAALDADPAQRLASQYAAQFSKPEALQVLLDQSPDDLWQVFFGADEAKGWMDGPSKAAILVAWAQDGAWEAMLNWYRASGLDFSGNPAKARPAPPVILTPTLLIWGQDDRLFAKSTLNGHRDIAVDFTLELIAGGGHGVFREDPNRYACLVRDFLTR
jgi:epoxide hydrolase 4